MKMILYKDEFMPGNNIYFTTDETYKSHASREIVDVNEGYRLYLDKNDQIIGIEIMKGKIHPVLVEACKAQQLTETKTIEGLDMFELVSDMEEQGALIHWSLCTEEDLIHIYRLSVSDANDLHYLIQRATTRSGHPEHCIEDGKAPAYIMKEHIVESLHAGLEGYSPHERVIITKFIDDMAMYAMGCKVLAEEKSTEKLIYTELPKSQYDFLISILQEPEAYDEPNLVEELVSTLEHNSSSF